MPERENVGNWMNGIVANRLLTRMKKNSANEVGHEAHEVAAADDVAAHAVAHEAVAGLADVLQPAGHHRALAGGDVEEPEDEDGGEHELQHRLGDAEVERLPEQLEVLSGTGGRSKSPGPGGTNSSARITSRPDRSSPRLLSHD